MQRKEAYPLQKVTLNLRRGDFDRLRTKYGTKKGAGRAIRELIIKDLDGERADARQGFAMTTEIIPEHLRELIARHTNATIERCAQVADEWDDPEIAAAIRKLKDAPHTDPNIIYPGKDKDFVFPEEQE